MYVNCYSIINSLSSYYSNDQSWDFEYLSKPIYSFIDLNKFNCTVDITKESYSSLFEYLQKIVYISTELKFLFCNEKPTVQLYKIDMITDFIYKNSTIQIANHFKKHFILDNNKVDRTCLPEKWVKETFTLRKRFSPHDKSIEEKTKNFIRYKTTFYQQDFGKQQLPKTDLYNFSIKDLIQYLTLFEDIKENDIKQLNPIYVRDKKYNLKKKLKKLRLNDKILKKLEQPLILSKEVNKDIRKKLIEIGVLLPFDTTKSRQSKWKVSLNKNCT